MPFDPSQPFEVVDGGGGTAVADKPAFNPNQPFEAVEDKPAFDPSADFEEVESDPVQPTQPKGVSLGEYARLLPASIAKGAGDAISFVGRVLGEASNPPYQPKTTPPTFSPNQLSNFGRDIADRALADYKVSEEAQKTTAGKLISGLGSTVPVLASGPLAPLTGAAQAGEGGRMEAEQFGGTEEEQAKALVWNAVTGAVTEKLLGVPALFKSAKKVASDSVKSLGRMIGEQVAKGFGREGLQETLQQFGQDAIAKWVAAYDPDRNLFDLKKLTETFLIGGAVGGGIGGVTQIAAAADARLRARQATLPPASPATVTTPSVEPALAPVERTLPPLEPPPETTVEPSPELAPSQGVSPDEDTSGQDPREEQIMAILGRHKLATDEAEKQQLWNQAMELDKQLIADEQGISAEELNTPEAQMASVANEEPPPVTPLTDRPPVEAPPDFPLVEEPEAQMEAVATAEPPPVAPINPEPEPVIQQAAPEPETARVDVAPPVNPEEPQIGVRNAITDQIRKAMDLPERVTPATYGATQQLADAEKAVQENPGYGSTLINEVNNKPRTLNTLETNVVLYELAARKMAADRAVADVNAATTSEEQASATERLSAAREELSKAVEATATFGTEQGRALEARKRILAQRYEPEIMQATIRAAMGSDVTEEQAAKAEEKVTKISTEIEQTDKNVAALEDQQADNDTKHYFDQLLKDTRTEAQQAAKVEGGIAKFIHDQAEAARKRIAQRRGKTFADPLGIQLAADVADHAIIGAEYIANGIRKLADFTTKLVEEFGEAIRPQAKEIFDASKAVYDATQAAPTKGKRAKKPVDVAALAAKDAEAGQLSHRTAYEMVRQKIKEDVEGFDAVMQAATDDLAKLIPGVTRRQVGAAFSEYGKLKFPSQEDLDVKLREMRRLEQLGQGILDAEEGNPPKASGNRRDKPTQAVREKQAELRRKMAEMGIETESETEQLASRNQARINALNNQIQDLDKQLQTGQKPVKGQPVADSPEVERLKAERDAMKAEVKRIEDESKPVKTDAQKQIDRLQKTKERLNEVMDGTREQKAPKQFEALSAAAEDLQAEIDAMRELAAQMKRDAKPKTDPAAAKERAQIKALEKAIDEYSRRVREADFSKKTPTAKPDSKRVAELKAIRDSRRSMYEVAKKAELPVKTETEKRVEASLRAIKRSREETERRIREKDFTPKPKRDPVITKEILNEKAKNAKAKAEFEQMRKEFELANRTALEKARDRAALLLQSARGLILGSDIGILARQGLFSWNRPVTAIKATAEAFKSALSPASMARWEIETQEREIKGQAVAPLRKKAGLRLTDTLNNPEELVVTRLLSRIPDFKVGGKTVRLSSIAKTLERFQTTFINAVRADLFDQAVKQGFSPEELKLRANFINSVTGSSNIKHVPRAMSAIFTSPRYEASRWETLAQPVRNLGALAMSGAKGELNRAALANLRDLTGTAAGILGLFFLAGLNDYEVEWNPMSSDFLKMRKGNDVWDVTAGLAPRLRDTLRLFVAIAHPSYRDNIGKTLTGTLLRAINPAIKTPIDQSSVAFQRARGEDKPKLPFTGFKSDEEREGWITLAPLIVQGINEALAEGPGAAIWTGLREFVGTSVNRYPKPKE